jgi:hypothetical protein
LVAERFQQHRLDGCGMCDELVDLLGLCPCELAPSLGGWPAVYAIEQQLHFLHAEADVFGKPHHRQSLEHVVRHTAGGRRCATAGQKAERLVVANGRWPQAGSARDFADGHCRHRKNLLTSSWLQLVASLA